MSSSSWERDEEPEQEEEIKPVVIRLRVRDTKGRAVYHTMPRAGKLQGLMDFYYTTVPSVAYGAGLFLYNGGFLRGKQTPTELDMLDGDVVEFFPKQSFTMSSLDVRMDAAAEKDQKPVIEYITLKVVDQMQNLIRHTMLTTDKLQAVMDAYYREVAGVQRDSGTFWFEAVYLSRSRTPAELKMEDGDLIDFFGEVDGGFRGRNA